MGAKTMRGSLLLAQTAADLGMGLGVGARGVPSPVPALVCLFHGRWRTYVVAVVAFVGGG